jgi:hypothetical protein
MDEPDAARLAVIVPVGPADAAWRELLPQLAVLPAGSELCLSFADSMPDDALPRLRADVPALRSCAVAGPRGRAHQLNAGVAATRAPHLWLLHADTRLTPAVPSALERTLVEAPEALGYFDLAFDRDGPRTVFLNRIGAWVRSRWLGLPFGDQGFVIARRTLAALGGFRADDGRGEDHALVWRARRAGVRLHPVRATLYTSARRYGERGWLVTTTDHLLETWRQVRRFRRMP